MKSLDEQGIKKYLFISNGNKPSNEEYLSKDKVVLNNFSIPNVEAALKLGYEVYMGVNRKYAEELTCDYPIKFYDANIFRSIYNIKDNLRAYKNLNKFLKTHDIDVIHCNTPIGGFLGRICGSKAKVPLILYTAHGFHFYKGAPKSYNIIFKTIERKLAKKTDLLITINEEDYQNAKKFKLKKGGQVFKVNGVGVETKDLICNEKTDESYIKEILGLSSDDKVVISAGDLVERKNYSVGIRAIKKMNNPKVHYAICGRGPQLEKLKKLTKKLKIENQIHFLGFRKDIKKLMTSSDVFLFTTKQEGLPRSLMEAMAFGLPVVVSNIRGNNDLIKDNHNGFLCGLNDYECFADRINYALQNNDLTNKMVNENFKLIKDYDTLVVKDQILDIYKEFL